MEKNWRAVYVSSRQEKKVNNLLSERGIETYLPLIKTLRQWSDRKKMVEFPMFKGYLFVRINDNQIDVVKNTIGVVNFVKIEGRLGLVRENEINNIKQIISSGYLIEVSRESKLLSEGDKVKINYGPLKNLVGIVIRELDKKLFELVLESVGFHLRVSLPDGVLQKVHED